MCAARRRALTAATRRGPRLCSSRACWESRREGRAWGVPRASWPAGSPVLSRCVLLQSLRYWKQAIAGYRNPDTEGVAWY
eukprot:207010-Rhodomonas_salina.2